jgi:hypothetical protein
MNDSLLGQLKYKTSLNLLLSVSLAFIPFFRLFSANSEYLSQTLWAEDGLFTLCYKKSSILNCSFDGYSGYLQLLPRFTGLIASLFDPQYWALAINIQAIFFYFLITFFLLSYLSSKKLEFSSKFVIASAPTLLAFSGLEIIGVISSNYLLLFYASLVYITFLDSEKDKKRFQISFFIILCTLALTSPFGLVAGIFLVIKFVHASKLGKNKLSVFLLIIANLFQIFVILSQHGNRQQTFLIKETLRNSLKSFVYIFYTPKSGDFLPGINFNFIEFLAAICIVILILFRFRTRLVFNQTSEQILNLAIQVLAFVSVLLISILSNGAVARYLNLLILIALLILVTVLRKTKILNSQFAVIGVLTSIIFNLGINFQVPEWRVSAPSWEAEWSNAINTCLSTDKIIPITFTPVWPTISPHSYPMFEPLTNRISCKDVVSRK